uniref:C2H2-type domain-containing protein n=1 Tax=Salarias fasciatus TaxID=181472 RepID=A0A672GA02_SALFA
MRFYLNAFSCFSAVLLQMKGKFVVNEKCLFQLLGRNCPSCQSKLQMEKVTYEAFLILNQRCLKCDYTNQWKNMAGAHIPAAEDGDAVEETSESQQAAAPSFNSAVVSEIVVFSDEESDASENVEEAEEEDESSKDEEWNLTGEVLLAEELELESENEEAEEESTDENKLGGGVVRELCAECGKFFDKRKHHVCAHKGRPFACNVCGKRCVSELSLKIHSRIHQENYQHLCKYCYLPFKTRVDKQKHEDAHKMKNDPYSCSDCPQTFTSYKQRRSHLLTHRGLRERKCGVCGMVFTSWEHLGRHSFVHTGLKPHKCSVCDRSFKQSSHLKSHMRLHTGERPYACSHCDRAFNHNVSLKSHVQQCHASNGGAQDETGPDVEFDGVEEEPKKKAKNDLKRRSSGRPVGRPKKTAEEKNLSNTARPKRRRPKKSTSSDEESEDDGDLSFESAEEDEEEEVKKHRGLPKRAKYDSDSDFNP